MIITGHEALLLTLLFVVTGYITHLVAARLIARRPERIELLLLRFLTYGALNVLVAFPLVLAQTKFVRKETWPRFLADNLGHYYGLTLLPLIVLPIGLGLLIGFLHWIYGVSGWYRTLATWDEQVARSRNQWVVVTLEEEKQVLGFLGTGSFVFTEAEDRDLYLQSLYTRNAAGHWQAVPRSLGMIIRGNTIKSIEFWRNTPQEAQHQPEIKQHSPGLRERWRMWRTSCNELVPPDAGSSVMTPAVAADQASEEKPTQAREDQETSKGIAVPVEVQPGAAEVSPQNGRRAR